MAGKVRLQVIEGVMQGQAFAFEEHDTFIFGRMDDCHACLPDDEMVSRHHFIMEVNPPDARIRDLGSLNGTYVNGIKYGGREEGETPEEGSRREYPEVDMKDGDQIKVGGTVLTVYVEVPAVCCQCGRDIAAAVDAARPGFHPHAQTVVGRTEHSGTALNMIAWSASLLFLFRRTVLFWLLGALNWMMITLPNRKSIMPSAGAALPITNHFATVSTGTSNSNTMSLPFP